VSENRATITITGEELKHMAAAAQADIFGNVSADQLRLFIERIERLEEEKKGLNDDIRDVYAESKANGYDTKTMRKVIALRRMEKHARDEADALLETYRAALGML
jgi:uncharacterized protein (UPF0335 family)